MTVKGNERIKAVAAMAMLTALAIAADIFLRIPNIGGILTYEPKEVILTIGAFIFVMFTFVGVNTLMSGLHSYA